MINLTKNAIQILEERYFLKDNKGHITETPLKLFSRVAAFVASCEKEKKHSLTTSFFELMSHLEFLPNSPTLMNAGCKNGQLSACFVLPIQDSLEHIFENLKRAALIHQSGGGTGFNFSELRPMGDLTSSAKGISSGPVSFMKIYDLATENVKQGGKRRGANMGILNINHPDIESFIISKSDKKSIQNFNISVGVTNDFMNALKRDTEWSLINPRTKKTTKILKAKTLWNLIVNEAWKTGDPGLIFLDTINIDNPTPKLGTIKATNPCGEVPLLDYESCNLGSINLSKMTIRKEMATTIDWDKLARTVHLAIRFLDNIITLNHYLIPEIKKITKRNRKIGLGVMGWAELLFLLGIPYASDQAVALGEKLMKFIKEESYRASRELALERGVFTEWKNSIHAPDNKLRNATCNSIAPTGSISVIANTSYSIEPLFALAYKRVGVLGNKTQQETNQIFVKQMQQLHLWNSAVENIVLESGSIASVDNIPEHIKLLFKTSLEIPWEYHLKHQNAFQKYTDNAVSKTINLPNETTLETISNIFMSAWEYKLKGITIYRYGSKNKQILQKCSLNTSSNC